MEFLVVIALISHGAQFGLDSYGKQVTMNEAYCQNLYWQPNALEKMQDYGCDIESVSAEISRVNSGKY